MAEEIKPKTRAQQVADWIEEEIGKVPELGVSDQGRLNADRTLALTFEDGAYVFVTVEQG